MSRADALRKLLALGELRRQEIEQVMGGNRVEVANAMAELHMRDEIRYVRDSSQQTHFVLTDEAKAAAFHGRIG